MSTAPQFGSTVNLTPGIVSTGNTSRTAPTNGVTVFTAGASGSILERVCAVAQGTTTVGVVRVFLVRSAVYYLLKEILVSAITPSTSIEVFRGLYTPYGSNGMKLKSGDTIYVTTNNAEAFAVWGEGSDL
jgi:hypothetical protein